MSLSHSITLSLQKLRKTFKNQNWVEISQSTILNNFDLFQSLHPEQGVIPVLKANAYGHGLEQIAEILKARTFPYIAVDGYFEALRIREVSPQPILVMGAIDPDNFKRMKCSTYTFVISDIQTVVALGALQKRVKVHIELETGMNRYGVKSKDLDALLSELKKYPKIQVEGVMSHLADADGPHETYTVQQVALFDAGVEVIRAAGFSPSIVHIGQSAGNIVAQSKYAQTFRLGLGLYGFNPFPAEHPKAPLLTTLRPALQIMSTITKVHELAPGESVSYGCTFTATRPTRIGVLPLGYYEGIPRALSNVGCGLSQKNEVLPIVGRICMNHLMVDITNTQVAFNDTVVVMSANPKDPNSVDQISSIHGIFNYLLLVQINENFKRIITP